MTKKRWQKLNFAEWRADPALSRCSRAARSLWLDLCGLIYDAEDAGRLTIGGKIPTIRELGKILGDHGHTLKALIAELESNGVFSRQTDGAIVSRRIAREFSGQLLRAQNEDDEPSDDVLSAQNEGGSPVENTFDRSLRPQKSAKTRSEPGPKTGKNFEKTAENDPPPSRARACQNPESSFIIKNEEDGFAKLVAAMGPGCLPAHEEPMATWLEDKFPDWLKMWDLDLDILPVVKRNTALERTHPLATLRPLRPDIQRHYAKRTAGRFRGADKPAEPRPPLDIPEGRAGDAVREIVAAKGEAWARNWLATAAFNGEAVYVRGELERERIDGSVGHILRRHGYTDVTIKTPAPDTGAGAKAA